MFRLVVFDLDGTLLDTAPDLYQALCDTLEFYRIEKKPSFEEFKKHIGGGAYGFLEPFLPQDLLEEALLKLRSFYLERYLCKNTRPFEGIGEVLKTLKERGIKLAVATNKITEGALRVLKAFRLVEYFEIVAGRDLPPKHKPHGEHIEYIISRLGIEPKETLMVGDRLDDILAAKNAGSFSAYALWGYTEPLNVESDFFLKEPKELLKLLID